MVSEFCDEFCDVLFLTLGVPSEFCDVFLLTLGVPSEFCDVFLLTLGVPSEFCDVFLLTLGVPSEFCDVFLLTLGVPSEFCDVFLLTLGVPSEFCDEFCDAFLVTPRCPHSNLHAMYSNSYIYNSYIVADNNYEGIILFKATCNNYYITTKIRQQLDYRPLFWSAILVITPLPIKLCNRGGGGIEQSKIQLPVFLGLNTFTS